jgi:hypothetical protein
LLIDTADTPLTLQTVALWTSTRTHHRSVTFGLGRATIKTASQMIAQLALKLPVELKETRQELQLDPLWMVLTAVRSAEYQV